jgi:oligopeptide/dipeptide ABC transporter ATP-binding protein
MTGDGVVLQVRHLKKYFPVTGGFFNRMQRYVRAVDDVSLDLEQGKTLGVVGESGCGKSTLGRCVLRLEEPTEGQVWFKGRELSALGSREMRETRREMQMVYQDPYSSLDPRMTVASVIAEPLMVHGIKGEEAKKRLFEMAKLVGLGEDDLSKYPHMFSGGQRQRISIARALVLNPLLVVLDEPTSALDVSVQARLLILFQHLQQALGLTYVFISHDMRTVRYISDEVAVMYLGQIVEQGPAETVFEDARHPYTRALLAAMPSADPDRKLSDLVGLVGEVPDPSDVPSGCRFWPRCAAKKEGVCDAVEPELVAVGVDHWLRCHVE